MKQRPIYRFVFGMLFYAVFLFLASSEARAQQTRRTIFQHYYHSMQPYDTVAGVQLLSGAGTTKPPTITRSPRRLKLLGRFGATDTLRYVIPTPLPHKRIVLDVAFHVIGSWDGVTDDDRFVITAGGVGATSRSEVFSESFSNTTYRQTYPGASLRTSFPSRCGARNKNMLGYRFVEPNVYDGPLDATYEFERTVNHTDTVLIVDVYAKLSDMKPGIENESWGMEHMVVLLDYDLPPSITPARVPTRIVDREIIEFKGQDERVVAGFTQDEDFPGMYPSYDVQLDVHARVIQTRCTSCGDVCLLYTYTLYSDGWINVWNNREPRGEATWWGQFTPDELDTAIKLIDQCLSITMQNEYATSDFSGDHSKPHCQLLLRNFQKEQTVSVDSGEPPQLTSLMSYMMGTLKRHGWFPTPY
jgi:hypothetical protein